MKKKRRKKDGAARSMKLFVIIVACDIALSPAVEAVRCYQCSVKTPDNSTLKRVCSKFEEREMFEVNCPLSTLCETRTFRLHTRNGSLSVTTRGCAQQDYSYQTYRRGHGWQTVTRVQEGVYRRGCFTAVGQHLRRHRTTYCYCQGNLCNGLKDEDGTRSSRTMQRTTAAGQTTASSSMLLIAACLSTPGFAYRSALVTR